MRTTGSNHYELVFENWLIDNHVKYTRIDETKRARLGKASIKSFDYLVDAGNGNTIIADVKGRKFKGTSFEKLTSLQCWVTETDITDIEFWQKIFGEGHCSVFIFAYEVENVDVDFDGREVYEYKGKRYLFFCIELDKYKKNMKVRSPKWKTVTLSAADFRNYAVEMKDFFKKCE
ncbi:MAG TPA: HYExAFE family protein [Sedimentisphaerales bacterium]|nr:HYExAFE family protein [Sedimentisphaerales bacterium]